jgi:heme/copper-type cytochrome/quinol oxidase subunit 2
MVSSMFRPMLRLTLSGLAVLLLAGATQSPASPQPRVVRIRAERFAFAPSEIPMLEGETVEFRIKSDDTVHGFLITGTSTDIAIPKRGLGEVSVLFTAGAPGRYAFECNRMCGAGHDFMTGEIVVRPRVVDGAGR